MDRTLLTVKHKLVWLLTSLKFICHIIVCLSTINTVDNLIYLITTDPLRKVKMEPVHKKCLLFWHNTMYLYITEIKRISA